LSIFIDINRFICFSRFTHDLRFMVIICCIIYEFSEQLHSFLLVHFKYIINIGFDMFLFIIINSTIRFNNYHFIT